jgi:flagellar hook-associated protein 3 FlgL
MRITQSMMARMGIEQLSLQRNRLARTQEMAATGLRVNRPSDDPVDYRTIQFLKDEMSQTGRYLRSIDLARTRIRTTEEALAGAADVVSLARVRGLEARNATSMSNEARGAIKVQIEQLFDQLVSQANVRAPGGGYVFSGLASDREAFSVTGDFANGAPPVVAFSGDASAIEVEIDKGVFIDVTRDGQAAFTGAIDVFEVLGRLWTGVDSGDMAAIDAALGDLDQAHDHFVLERAEIGGAEAKADSFEGRLRLQEQELAGQVSFLEDADAYEVYSDLTAQESALQASLQVTSRLLQPSLLDFI